MTGNDTQVSRRHVAKGLAWAAPALTIGAAAPAVAASTVCPTVGATGWTESSSNMAKPSNVNYLNGAGIEFSSDATPGKTGTDTFSTQIPVQAGRTYRFTFTISTRYGYSSSNTTFNTNAVITMGGQTLFSGSTQSGNGGTLVQPTKTKYTWGAGGVDNASQTVTVDYKATTTGSVTFAYAFTLKPPTETNNDDWRIYTSLACL